MTGKWKTLCRPGYLGSGRDAQIRWWNEEHGEGSWRLAWKMSCMFVDFLGVCALYEDAYFAFLSGSPQVLEQLLREASNVYDDAPSNVVSGFDYTIQETAHTHVQDIAIRRVVLRMNRWFSGSDLIQIRDAKGDHPLSLMLSPGRVPFHLPNLIEKPELEGWWLPGSVESFYQSTRFLQVREL